MKNYLIAAIAAVAAMATTGCNSGKGSETSGVDSTKQLLVRTLPAVSENIDNIAEFTGSIEPFVKNNISPSLPVRIDQILVEVGDYVHKGQLLVRMDPTQYNQTAVRLASVQADYDRTKNVYDAGGVSKQSLDAIKTELDVLQESTRNLKENIELRSPIDGVVTARYYDAGDYFSMSPGQAGVAAVLTVMQISKLKILMNVSEQYFPQVKQGMPVTISTDLYPDRDFKGSVSLIYPSIDASTRTFAVEVAIPNASGVLRPGMFARTTLNLGTRTGTIVEDLAVARQIGTNEKYVFVVKDGKALRRTVTTGRHIENKIDILSGVAAGEQVVVSGTSKLIDGMEVKVAN